MGRKDTIVVDHNAAALLPPVLECVEAIVDHPSHIGRLRLDDTENCQPIEVNHQKGRMALAHNGNLSNAAQLRSKLELTGAIFPRTALRHPGIRVFFHFTENSSSV